MDGLVCLPGLGPLWCDHVPVTAFDRGGIYRYRCMLAPNHDGPHRCDWHVSARPTEPVHVHNEVL